MYIGNVILLILNLPLIGLSVQILKVPYSLLSPLIIMFVLLGAYALNNSVTDIQATILFGLIGYVIKRYNFEPLPLVLAFVLRPMMETSFRQSVIMSPAGSIAIFFSRPISAMLLIIAILVLFLPLLRRHLKAPFQTDR